VPVSPRISPWIWSRPVDRNTLLWTLVVFFGASIMFGAIGNATADEGAGVRLAAQLGAGLLLVGAIVIVYRRRR
jgi:drug/metabolite transporter (DMT)-like permease